MPSSLIDGYIKANNEWERLYYTWLLRIKINNERKGFILDHKMSLPKPKTPFSLQII